MYILGAIVYRLILTYAFQLGLPTSDIKLFSAAVVILAIFIPSIKPRYENGGRKMLEIKNVSVIFNKDTINERRALDNVSLVLNDGDFVKV